MAFLIAGTLLWIAALPSATDARPLIAGITNIGEESPLAFEQARATGAQFIRLPLYWQGTAPKERPQAWQPEDPDDPEYFWGPSDRDVVRAVQAGLTPVLQVENAPTWAQRCHTPASLSGPTICDPDPADLRSFAIAAAHRYSGAVPGLPRVDYWQALNEPNLSLFFFPQFDTSGRALSPALYRALVNSFYSGIKSVDPAYIVIAAGLGPTEVHPWTIGPMRFARKMLCMRGTKKPRPTRGDCDGGVNFDIFAIHPYTSGGPTHKAGTNDVPISGLPKLRTLIRAADRTGRIKGMFKRTPLWVTEFSWDTKPPDPGGLAMRIATRWTAEALHKAWRAGVTHFFWFSLRDSKPNPDRPFNATLESGLYFRGATLAQDQPKPVMHAFRFPFVAYPRRSGLAFWGRTPNSRGGRVAIQVWRRGNWRRVSIRRAGKQGILRGMLKLRYGRNKRGQVRAVYHGQASPAFSMRGVKDFRHPPFG